MSAKLEGTPTGDSGAAKIHNADEFANYVHAVSVPMKIVMAAIVVFFAGIITFCIFGKVPVTISVVAVVDDTGTCTCYIKAADRNGIELGDAVEINDETYQITEVSSTATCVDDTFDEYARSLGDISIGDYVFLATVDCDLSQSVYEATLTKDYLQPLSALLNS